MQYTAKENITGDKLQEMGRERKKQHEERLINLCNRVRTEAQKAGLALTFNLRLNFFASMSVVVQASLARIDFLLERLTSK